MILQLAIDTANECQTNESLDGIMQQKFEKILKNLFKESEEKAKENRDPWIVNQLNYNKHFIIVGSKFDDERTWIYDAIFCEFVKGQMTNSKKFVRLSEGFYGSMFVHVLRYLGIVYLMRVNWHCDNIGNEFREKCQKYRKYLHIFYEFLFQICVQGKNAELAYHVPAVKPIFTVDNGNRNSLVHAVKNMENILKCFLKKDEKELNLIKMILQNEEELNYGIKEEKSGENPSKTEIQTNIAKLRKEFERKMKNFCKKAKENAKTAKEKLEKALSETEDDREEYNYDFGTFDLLPFS